MFPFQGNFDWDGFIRGLREINFSGTISIEADVNPRTPEPLREKMRVLLAETAKYLAEKI